jgi:hypothetical protein
MKKRVPSIEKRFADAVDEASRQLASLTIVKGRTVSVKGLRGWLFEQTVRTCLEEELEIRGISVAIEEQASIGGRASVDLVIGPVAIEIKSGGFFSDVSERYLRYRTTIEAKGWHYFYLTLGETYAPYVKIARRTFGSRRAFFLDQKGEWPRFVSEVVILLRAKKEKPNKSPEPTPRLGAIRTFVRRAKPSGNSRGVAHL